MVTRNANEEGTLLLKFFPAADPLWSSFWAFASDVVKSIQQWPLSAAKKKKVNNTISNCFQLIPYKSQQETVISFQRKGHLALVTGILVCQRSQNILSQHAHLLPKKNHDWCDKL